MPSLQPSPNPPIFSCPITKPLVSISKSLISSPQASLPCRLPYPRSSATRHEPRKAVVRFTSAQPGSAPSLSSNRCSANSVRIVFLPLRTTPTSTHVSRWCRAPKGGLHVRRQRLGSKGRWLLSLLLLREPEAVLREWRRTLHHRLGRTASYDQHRLRSANKSAHQARRSARRARRTGTGDRTDPRGHT